MYMSMSRVHFERVILSTRRLYNTHRVVKRETHCVRTEASFQNHSSIVSTASLNPRSIESKFSKICAHDKYNYSPW